MKNPDFVKLQVNTPARVEAGHPKETPAYEAATAYARIARINEKLGRENSLILETFSHEFADQLPALLTQDFKLLDGTRANFQTIIDKHLAAIQEVESGAKEISEAQQSFVHELVQTMSKLPVKNWNISPRQLVENGGANCSVAAATLQMILESTQGSTAITKIDYVIPPGHAFNMVTFPDGSIFYADPRNGIFENVTQGVSVSQKQGLTVYKLTKPNERMPFRYITALNKSRDGMVTAYLGNILEVPGVVSGDFPTAFADTSKAERDAMQIEAQGLADRPELKPEKITHTCEVKDQLYAPLKRFFADPNNQKEIAQFGPAIAPDEARVRIGKIMQTDNTLRLELKNRADELRAFLLADIDTFTTADETLTGLLADFRSGRAKAWTLIHHTRTEREQEVDALITQL